MGQRLDTNSPRVEVLLLVCHTFIYKLGCANGTARRGNKLAERVNTWLSGAAEMSNSLPALIRLMTGRRDP